MEFGNPIVGGEDLIRTAIKSPDFNTDPESGNVTGWRIARDGSATFYNLTIGSATFNIDQNGNAVFNDVTVNGDLFINGESVADQLMMMSDGVQAWADLTGSSPVSVTTSDTIVARITLPEFDPTRVYTFNALMHINVGSVQPTYVGLRVRYAWGTNPTTSSPILCEWQAGGRAATATDEFMTNRFIFDESDLGTVGTDLRLLVSTFSSIAGIQIESETWNRIWIEDMGPLIQRVSYDMTGGTPPTQQYVKTYAANESASYQEDGSNRGIADCYQGRYSATNGNQYSMIGFDDALIRSDTSGSTINKVELYLNNNHFYSNSGGNAVIGTHNQTTLSGSHSSSQINDNLQQTHFDLGQAKWITIPNSIGTALRDNTAKGIALGPGPTTSQSYYGYFAGNGQSGEPQLRITYTK